MRATVNGGARADVAVGEEFVLVADIAAPPGGGTIVAVEWDIDGRGLWSVTEGGIDGTQSTMAVRARAQLDEPGTYFPAVRVTAHRDGDGDSEQRRLVNLGRVRVVVNGA